MHKVALTLAQLTYEQYEKRAFDILVKQNSAAAEDVVKWQSRVDVAESSHLEAPRPSSNAPTSIIIRRSTG